MTQQELADKAGVSLRTIQYFENSNDIRLESFIRILSALDLAKQLDELIPDMEIRPSVLLQKSRGKEKQRVRKSRKSDAGRTFRWGDEK
ncbi:MAG: helix-turn-helix domain-containing protein [Lachnospiraceae bacterium]|nr:helix-turn-helix domain-containing protein [Lachnospiraceae bacterium]